MTLPKNRILKNARGFQAQADVGINSPIQTNNQNVNVIVSPPNAMTKDKTFHVLTDVNTTREELDVTERNVDLEVPKDGLNDELEPNFKERSIESAKHSLEEMETLLKDKDNLIEALSLILDMYENNPLIVNKFIVAKEEELSRLIFLLTGAEQIELIKNEPEVGCCMKESKYTYISKIMIKKNGNTYNFKYSFSNCVQLLDNRRISWKLVY